MKKIYTVICRDRDVLVIMCVGRSFSKESDAKQLCDWLNKPTNKPYRDYPDGVYSYVERDLDGLEVK